MSPDKETNKNIIKNTIKSYIKNYINENSYIFYSSDTYNLNCHIRPRLVLQSLMVSCSQCRENQLLDHCNGNCYIDMFKTGMHYSSRYANIKNII